MPRIRDEVYFLSPSVEQLWRSFPPELFLPLDHFSLFLRRWEVLEEADLPVREKGLYWDALHAVVSDICLRCKQMTLLPEQ